MIQHIDSALRALLHDRLGLPLPRITVSDSPTIDGQPLVNLHLVSAQPDASRSGQPRTGFRLPDAGAGKSPVAVDLIYVVSTHGPSEEAHRLLGEILVLLHQEPVIPSAMIPEPARREDRLLRLAVVNMRLEILAALWTNSSFASGAPIFLSVTGAVLESESPSVAQGG